jgi:hypothetical protein
LFSYTNNISNTNIHKTNIISIYGKTNILILNDRSKKAEFGKVETFVVQSKTHPDSYRDAKGKYISRTNACEAEETTCLDLKVHLKRKGPKRIPYRTQSRKLDHSASEIEKSKCRVTTDTKFAQRSQREKRSGLRAFFVDFVT